MRLAPSFGLALVLLWPGSPLAAAVLPANPPPAIVPIPKPNPLRVQAGLVPGLATTVLGNPRFYAAAPPSLPETTCPLPYAGTGVTRTIPGSANGSAVYGSTYGENYGAGPGSTLDQSSAVLGAPCALRPPDAAAVPGSGQPWLPRTLNRRR